MCFLSRSYGEQFQQILQDGHNERRRHYVDYLKQLPELDFLLEDEKDAIAKTFVERRYEKDDVICKSGQELDFMMVNAA